MAEFEYILRQVWDAAAELLQNGPGIFQLRQCNIIPALYRIFLEFFKCWLNGIFSYSGAKTSIWLHNKLVSNWSKQGVVCSFLVTRSTTTSTMSESGNNLPHHKLTPYQRVQYAFSKTANVTSTSYEPGFIAPKCSDNNFRNCIYSE